MRKAVASKSGQMGSKNTAEDLQIFLQYVKSALMCVIVECSTLENVKDTIEELISEIDSHAQGDITAASIERFTRKSKALVQKVEPPNSLENDEDSHGTTDYTDYFDDVKLGDVIDDTVDNNKTDEEAVKEFTKNLALKNEQDEELNGDVNAGVEENEESGADNKGEDSGDGDEEQSNSMQEEEEEEEEEEVPFKCQLCNIEFARKRSLLLHLVKKDHAIPDGGTVEDIASGLDDDDLKRFRSKLHTCADCGKQFTTPSLLSVHKMVHNYSKSKRKLSCKICKKKFSQPASLKVHLAKIHGSDIDMPKDADQLKAMLLTCEFCGKVFHKANSLMLHRKSHSSDKPYNCSVCKKGFTRKSALQKHKKTYNHSSKKPKKEPAAKTSNTDVRIWHCELCKESFTNRVQYYEHFNTHKDGNGFKCPGCERKFTRKESLKWHMATTKHTFKGNEENMNIQVSSSLFGMKIISCEYCGKNFNKPSAHRLHLSTHTGEKPWECTECDKAFSRKYHLKEHMEQRHNPDKAKDDADKPEKTYKCVKCGKFYSTHVSLRAHLSRHDGMKYKCNDCGKLFMRKESLQMHVVREGCNIGKDLSEFSRRLITCNICGKKLLRPSLLLKHMRTHVGQSPPHFCSKCLEVFENEEEKTAHECPVKQTRWKSDRSSKSLQDEITKILIEQTEGSEDASEVSDSLEQTYKNMSVDELESLLKLTGEAAEMLTPEAMATKVIEHLKAEKPIKKTGGTKEMKSSQRMRAYFINKALRMKSEKGKFKKDGKTYYKCSYCPKYFARRGVMQNHERRHTGSKPFNCPTCGRAFAMIATMKNHLLTHANEKPHQCTMCDKGFVQKASLMRHMFMHTGKVLPHKCDVCNKAFYREGELKKHKMKHDGTEVKVSHICEQCGKSFCTKQGLKNHGMLHEPIKKYYTCEICNRQFTLAIRLKKHMLVHSDEKPFICNYCGKRFARSHYLTNHIRVHTGEKRFKCTYCFKGFTTSGQLSIHTRSHTGEKPYACSICGKRSTDSANHIKHMRTHQDKSTLHVANSKHRSSNNNNHQQHPHQNTNNTIPNTNTHTHTLTQHTNANPHIHINQNMERHVPPQPMHTENLINMKHMRPLDNDSMLQQIQHPMQLTPHNTMPPEAHGQSRLARTPNFFNMPSAHLPMTNTGYPDASQFMFRYNDRM